MVNVDVKVTENELLILTIDLKKTCGYTKGGKNVLIGSSRGNIHIPTQDGKLRAEKFNVNVFRAWTPKEQVRGSVKLEGWGDEEP